MNISKFSWLWSVLAMLSLTSGTSHNPSHIVFIMVDDMGWNDVSFHGADQIQTPNIDSLAYQGVILQQYYTEPICTPTRTSLLTGKYAMRLGMHGKPLKNAEHRGIPLNERLLPTYLKDLGYATHLVGKWHVGMSMNEFLPTSRGYDSHYGIRGGAVDYYTYYKIEEEPDGRLMSGLDLFDNEIPQDEEQRYIVDAFTDRAINIIKSHNVSQPLFLHVAHNAPHAGNEGANLQPPLYTTVKNKHIVNSNRRLYAEIVTHIDRSIGQLVRALAEKNILNDTIIAFVSDNGAPTVGEYANWGVNLPFRGQKDTPWEGGSRVPAFIWHASFRPRVWNGIMHITDWLPTLITAAGGKINTTIDGVNQWDSIFKDEESKRKEVLSINQDKERGAYAFYRAGDYKIVVGNMAAKSNGYYGAEFMVNKQPPPDYYSALNSCEVAKWFTNMGKSLNNDTVNAIRRATKVTQEDLVSDLTPCIPSLTRGCLFNIRKDPEERHDLWQRASKIAIMLENRLRCFWAQQLRRGPVNIGLEADPANFGYIWWPWVESSDLNVTGIPECLGFSSTFTSRCCRGRRRMVALDQKFRP